MNEKDNSYICAFACVLVSFSGCGYNQLFQTDTKDILKDNMADITEPIEAMAPTEEQMRPHQISVEDKNPKPKATSFFSWENWKVTVYKGISYSVGTVFFVILAHMYGERIRITYTEQQ
jgi:hypothetical protein